MTHVTGNHFYRYVSCPSWVYRDAYVDAKELHPLLHALHEQGLLPEVKRALLEGRDHEEVDVEDHDEAFVRTLALMKSGVQTILHGALVHGRYVARPDVLERVEGRSRFGDYYYVACDIKSLRKLRRDVMFSGAFSADVLHLIQGVKPNQGYMMTPDGLVLSFVLADVEEEYHLTLHRIERILAGEEPSEFLTSRCKATPWFSDCKGSVEGCDDLSRINRIWREEATRIKEAGYETVDAFAREKPNRLPDRIPNIDAVRLRLLHAQANVLVAGRHRVLGPVTFPKAPVELFFDVEADPLRDLEYLFGVLAVRDREETFHPFLAKTPREQKDAWEQFVNFVASERGMPIYHWGWYEVDVVRRLGAKYDTAPDVIEEIIERMIDLLALLRPNVLFPLSFYSLKDVAGYTGFSWRAPDASGANSVLWYEDWLAFEDEAKLRKILEYNEDDVRATAHVKAWVEREA